MAVPPTLVTVSVAPQAAPHRLDCFVKVQRIHAANTRYALLLMDPPSTLVLVFVVQTTVRQQLDYFVPPL